MVIAVISTTAAIGIVQLTNTSTAVKSTKLQQDVAALNRAIKTYALSGGDLTRVGNGAQVIAKLKTVAAVSQRSKIAGLRGTMIDPRITPIAIDSGELPRAVWNDSKKTFFVQNTGAGFSEFILDDTITAPAQEDTRTVTMALDNQDKWIWKFNEEGTASPRPVIAVGAATTPVTPVAPSDPIRIQLEAPAFSLKGGDYPLKNFDLNLSLANSNPVGSSEILFSVSGGPYQRYSSPLIVAGNSAVSAFTVSLNPDTYSDSAPSAETYAFQPVALQLGFTVPKTAVTYQEMGGRMIAGSSPLPAPLAGGLATLVNSADLPDKYQNDSVFNIRWTYDGGDPLKSTGAATGSPFSGAFTGQSVATTLDYWGTNSSLQIQVAAKALNPTVVSSSPVVGAMLTALPVGLGPPLIKLDPVTGEVIIALNTQFSDVPEGARIGYTTDGTTPSDKLTPSDKGLYTGPFWVASGTKVTARVYPPDSREVWFTTSAPAAMTYAPPDALGGIDIYALAAKYLFFFADGSVDLNWQGSAKGYAGNVLVDGVLAAERTSGGVPYKGTIQTSESSLGVWQAIVNQNAAQATGSTGNTGLVAAMKNKLNAAFTQINGLAVTPGYASRGATSLNGLNTQNSRKETFVINVTSDFSISSKINITGDSSDAFIFRWDTDANFANGYDGIV